MPGEKGKGANHPAAVSQPRSPFSRRDVDSLIEQSARLLVRSHEVQTNAQRLTTLRVRPNEESKWLVRR